MSYLTSFLQIQSKSHMLRTRAIVEDLPRPVLSGFVFQNSEDCPHPVFFVSVDSERLKYSLTSLESTLLGFLTSVDSKEVRVCKTRKGPEALVGVL